MNNIGNAVEKRVLLGLVAGIVNWCIIYAKQYERFLEIKRQKTCYVSQVLHFWPFTGRTEKH